MCDTAYGVSTASIYDRDFYVPVGFIMSLGPTGLVSRMNPGFVGGRVHNLEPITETKQPTSTSTVTTNVLCTIVLSSDPLPVDHKSSPGNKLANAKRTDERGAEHRRSEEGNDFV
jgi:hypothetical protein